MIGNDMALDRGVGTRGTGQPVPVGVGQPTLKMGGSPLAVQLPKSFGQLFIRLCRREAADFYLPDNDQQNAAYPATKPERKLTCSLDKAA